MSMNTKTPLVALVLLAAIGTGCEQEQSSTETVPPAPAPAEPAAESANADAANADAASVDGAEARADAVAAAPATSADAGTEAEAVVAADPGSPPRLEFAALEKVRPLDLIDMQLDFPANLAELDGREVSLVGFMAPFDSLDDMRRCMILPSYVGCNFCAPPRINQVVYVTQGEDGSDERFEFIDPASIVTGTFRMSLPDTDHAGEEHGFIYTIENAVVTAYSGEGPARAEGHADGQHTRGATTMLEGASAAEIIDVVAELLDRAPLRPIEVERISPDGFGEVVRSQMVAAFPEETRETRARAYRMLGLLSDDTEGVDLADVVTEYTLSLRIAASNATGDRIWVLDNVSTNRPFSRLELVGVIADALARQHFPIDAAGSDDERRAFEALRLGLRTLAMDRYARTLAIASSNQPPPEFVHDARVRRRGKLGLRLALESAQFGLWLELPAAVGAFFADLLVSGSGPLSAIEPALSAPPSTTMEFFRPSWYHDAELWRNDAVPSTFADGLLDTPPVMTDVFGVGGLVPWLTQWYSVEVSKTFAGGWAGDRWALWELPEGGSALLLETRWQDEAAALQFRQAIPRRVEWFLEPHEPGSTRVRLVRADSMDVVARLAPGARADS